MARSFAAEHGGAVLEWRAVMDKRLWNDCNPAVYKVWRYLAMKAYFKAGECVVGSYRVKVGRGEYVSTHSQMAQDCHVEVRVLRGALDRLASYGCISVEARERYTLIRVVNYEPYNDFSALKTGAVSAEIPESATAQAMAQAVAQPMARLHDPQAVANQRDTSDSLEPTAQAMAQSVAEAMAVPYKEEKEYSQKEHTHTAREHPSEDPLHTDHPPFEESERAWSEFDPDAAFLEFWRILPEASRIDQPGSRSLYLAHLHHKPDPQAEHERIVRQMRERWPNSRKWREGILVAAKKFIKENRWDERPEQSKVAPTVPQNAVRKLEDVYPFIGITDEQKRRCLDTDDERAGYAMAEQFRQQNRAMRDAASMAVHQ